MPSDTRIKDLLSIAEADRDRDWLLQALQNAVELELATLPPYLCGLWSIRQPAVGPNTAYSLILSVVFEEMLHMGLACNMLTTIGGTPHLVVPSYPGPLPGGVRPELSVYLSGLTPAVVKDVFMQIETPEHPVRVEAAAQTYPTIGAFYDAIAKAFAQAGPSIIQGERQLTTTFGQINEALCPITSLALAEKAIQEIKEQGEGTSQSPDAVGFGGELAHYYRFGEIYYGKTLVKVPGSDQWSFDGDPIPFPDCWPMAVVPEGGYPGVTADFDGLFTSVLASLETAWAQGGDAGQSYLQNAINLMFGLSAPAIGLMGMPIPGGTGNYGPDFRLTSPSP